jgi:hypothetical protein
MEENKNVTPSEPKTFTQEELNGIVEERIKRERAKYEGFDDLKAKADKYDEMVEASKTELQKATERAEKLEAILAEKEHAETVRATREKVASETGVPVALLTADTEEACKAQASGILSFAKPSYPNVKDGGDMSHVRQPSTRQQFAEAWAKQI